MKENDLNTIIKNSFNAIAHARAFKIPDGQHGISIQSPMDAFGAFQGFPLYYETKLIKNELNAFSFSKIEDHQFENLLWYHNNLVVDKFCLFIIGYYVPHSIKGVFIFDAKFVYDEAQKGLKSFKKPQMIKWKENGFFLPINYYTINGKRQELIENLESMGSKIIKEYQ